MPTLWPREAPVPVLTAVAGLFVMVALIVINLVTVMIVVASGGVLLEDLVLVALFVGLAVGIGLARPWARFGSVAVAVLFLLGAVSLFQSGIPGIVKVLGGVQIVVLVAVIGLLLLRESGQWFGQAR